MVTIRDKKYKFVKPYYLMEVGGAKLIKAKVKGSTLVWNLGGSKLTYNRIKNKLKNKS
jgi:hypothetical protein